MDTVVGLLLVWVWSVLVVWFKVVMFVGGGVWVWGAVIVCFGGMMVADCWYEFGFGCLLVWVYWCLGLFW